MALLHHGLTEPMGSMTMVKGGWITVLHQYPVEMAQNFWTAIIAFTVSASLTVFLSLVTRQQKTDAELTGLVYSLTPRELSDRHLPWYERPAGLAILVGAISIVLTIIFW
jgi:SSS family solute:Na+ symporter